MSFVEQRQGPPMIIDEIPRTYYSGRGFLTDQEAYPENPFYRAPRYSGGMNVPGAPGNLVMPIATNYSNPVLSSDTRNQEAFFQQQQNKPQAPGFDPENLYVQPKIQPGDPGWNPFFMEQLRDRFILNNPRSGVAEMPRYIRGKYAPSGAIIKAPHLDSPYMDEQIRRGFVPMTPPPARPPGPQLFPLAQAPANFDRKYVS